VDPKQEIVTQIDEAVKKHPIVLFMKGTPVFPQCGFSAKAVQILESYGKPIRTVDVLANPLVREAIKEYSRWPTIPQCFIAGQFVGGSDILAEMHESGELAALLQNVPDAESEQ
jgi:monothiol glutaredoxin